MSNRDAQVVIVYREGKYILELDTRMEKNPFIKAFQTIRTHKGTGWFNPEENTKALDIINFLNESGLKPKDLTYESFSNTKHEGFTKWRSLYRITGNRKLLIQKSTIYDLIPLSRKGHTYQVFLNEPEELEKLGD